jgi:fatty acid omega-hydroxylase
MEVRPRDLAPVADELRGAGEYDAAAKATAACA